MSELKHDLYHREKVPILSALPFLLCLACLTTCAPRGPLRLANDTMAVTIDAAGGRIGGLENRLTGERWDVDSVEFSILSDRGTQTSDHTRMTEAGRKGDSVQFAFEGGPYQGTLHYRLGDAWVEKWLTFRSSQPVILKRITLGARKFTPSPPEIHHHSDNTVYNVPICWFLRGKQGGIYTGIEYPYTTGEQRDGCLTLSYGGWSVEYDLSERALPDMVGDRPYICTPQNLNVRLEPGQEFTTEKEFLGVYRKAGLSREKALTGVPRILTTIPERLDWGEVWAMQRFMRHVLPPLPFELAGFKYYFNGWWAGTPGGPITEKDAPTHMKAIDQAKELGASLFALSPTWMGMDQFFRRNSEFVRTVGRNLDFHLSPAAQKVIDHIQARGLWLAPYCEGASFYREDRPDWKLVTADGKRPGYLCWANPEASNWYFELHNKIFAQYKIIKFWNWDGGWLPRDPNDPRSWECFATNHGHPPGNIAYLSFQNVMSIFTRLRAAHPEVALGVAWAVKSGGPWAARDLYVLENYYENQGPDDLRFQMWYVQNSGFIPCDKNMAQVWFDFNPSKRNLPEKTRDYWKMWFTRESRDYRYALMSALASGSDIGFIVQFPEFKSEMARTTYLEFMKKWGQWSSENVALLRAKRDLFGQPLRQDGIDGSAHIVGDHGFIFIFNPTESRHIVSIPLDERILLTSGTRFKISVIHPEPAGALGSYNRGEEVFVDMPAGSCKVLEVTPYEGPPIPIAVPGGADVQKAFP